MVELKKYKNKKIAIYGMGLTGFSVAKTLKKSGADVFCWDDNIKIRKKIKKINLATTKFWLNKKESIDNIVLSPGIDINRCKIKKYLKKNLKKIITDLDIFFEFNKESQIISITGTNGKSTTCKIIEKILKEAKYKVNTVGNIGAPVLSLSKIEKKTIFILEVSSYQLQYSRFFRSKYAAILNISPDHLERHKSMKNYIKTKSRIFFGQKKTDYSYINDNNRHSKYIKNIFKSKNLNSKLISVKKSSIDFLLKKINNNNFKTRGNLENLAFAYKISEKLKISKKTIIKAINSFKSLPHRQEIIFSSNKVLCINDSKATSFDACLQSLSNYNRIYWIVGGEPKLGDKFSIKQVKGKIVKAYIIGKSIDFFKKKIMNLVPYKISNNLSNALNNIKRDMKINKESKSTILLSPAAASFDQFSNFENRGKLFKKLIKKNFR